ncbi:MAG: tRNA (adenosine(37)-N6)-threonylcarbamoyltransferase complex dimerization subunit type 1 TsaB [Acidobacteria bacterium]|nr:MAG: tRNA (adenosine(37)-N6)-threonylcarbamoyltransferase complex dimerization subunit type 1 TsaB [Acidobacteriota bacterium]
MRVLAVDTTSERGSVCVTEGGEVLGEIRLACSVQYSERLFRSIEFIFQHLPFQLSDIDVFAAARGPGSFTGLRVGLAAMEAFAAAHKKRGAGVSTLEALAWNTGIRDVVIASTMDARRGDIYGALYRRVARNGHSETLVEERPPVVLKPAQWLASLPRVPLIFCGDGAYRYCALIEEQPGWSVHSMDLYLASTIAELAAMPNSGPLAPLYVRKTDAEIAVESVGRPNS